MRIAYTTRFTDAISTDNRFVVVQCFELVTIFTQCKMNGFLCFIVTCKVNEQVRRRGLFLISLCNYMLPLQASEKNNNNYQEILVHDHCGLAGSCRIILKALVYDMRHPIRLTQVYSTLQFHAHQAL